MTNLITAQLRRTDADAVAIAEELMSNTIRKLPSFPGFERRTWSSMNCDHDDEYDHDSVHIEVTYGFGAEASTSPLTRHQYVPLIRQIWSEEGHEIFQDNHTDEDDRHSIEASAAESLNLYYRVAHVAYFRVYSGCVARTDEFPDIPALGGVPLENDKAQTLINPPPNPGL